MSSTRQIAIPSDDGKNISLHFGRCKYFVIYEIDGKKIVARKVSDNIYCPHRSGVCPKTVKSKDKTFLKKHEESVLFELKDCGLVIGSYINPVLKKTLQKNNIKYMVVDEKLAEEAIRKYLINALVDNKDNKSICEKQSCSLSCLK